MPASSVPVSSSVPPVTASGAVAVWVVLDMTSVAGPPFASAAFPMNGTMITPSAVWFTKSVAGPSLVIRLLPVGVTSNGDSVASLGWATEERRVPRRWLCPFRLIVEP